MDYQKVYPEASPSVPVEAENLASKSKKAPQIDTLPLYTAPDSVPLPPPTNPRRKRSRWCRCLCWTLLSIIIFIVVIAAIVGILYLVFRPKIPHYSVNYLTVNALSIDNNNLTANASFDINVTARNPNKRIGIYYLDGSDITAWYNTTQLCNGTFPVFYQGHKNTTVIHLLLSGQPQLTNELISGIQSQLSSGSIPIIVKGNVPVKVKFGALKLFFKITGKVNCKLMLDISSSDGSSSNSQFKFRSSSCSFKVKL